MSRKGCAAAPAMSAAKLKNRGRFAPLSQHKAAPSAAPAFEYQCFPTLDLIAPDAALLQQAANAIERLRAKGPLLVCCALGYSRSASAVAAWLLLSGRCSDAQQAEALIRKARPGSILHPAHRLALQQLGAQP